MTPRLLLAAAVVAVVPLLPALASAQSVLVFDDTSEAAEGVNAAGRLGLEVVSTRNIAGFARELETGRSFDVILFDVSRLALLDEVITGIDAHLADGGSLIAAFHDLDAYPVLRDAMGLTCTGNSVYAPLVSTPVGFDIFQYRDRITSPLAGVSRRADEGDYCTGAGGITLATLGGQPGIVTALDGHVIWSAISGDNYRATDADTDGISDAVELYTNLLQLALDLQAPDLLVYADGPTPITDVYASTFDVDVVTVSTPEALDAALADEDWAALFVEVGDAGALDASFGSRVASLRAGGTPVVLSGAAAVLDGLGATVGPPAPMTGLDAAGPYWGEVIFSQPERIPTTLAAGPGAEGSALAIAGDLVALARAGGEVVVAGAPLGRLVVSGLAFSALDLDVDADGDGRADAAELLADVLAFAALEAAPALVLSDTEEAGRASLAAQAVSLAGLSPVVARSPASFAAAVAAFDGELLVIEADAADLLTPEVAGAVADALSAELSVVVAASDYTGAGDLLAAIEVDAGTALTEGRPVERVGTHLGRVYALPEPVAAALAAPAEAGASGWGTPLSPAGGTVGSVVARFGTTGAATVQARNGQVLASGFSPALYGAIDADFDRVPDVVELLRNHIESVLRPQTALLADDASGSILAEGALRAGLAVRFAADGADVIAATTAAVPPQQIAFDVPGEALLADADVVTALLDWTAANRALLLYVIDLDGDPDLATAFGVTALDRTQLRPLVESADDTSRIFREPLTVPSPLTISASPYADLGDAFEVPEGTPVAARYAFNTGPVATAFLDGGTTALNGFGARQVDVDDLDEDGVDDIVEYVANQFVRVGRVPVAVVDVPETVEEGASADLDASRSFDPFDEALTFAWDLDDDGDFDDGTSPNATFSAAGVDGDGTESRRVAVRVTNASGLRAVVERSILIVNAPPRIEAGPDRNIDQGTTARFSVSINDVPGETFTVEWDVGDESAPLAGATVEHSYTTVGPYTVTVTVTDDDGGVAQDSFVATYRNVAPAIEIGSYAAIDEGGEVTVTATTSDPGGDAFAVSWTFGDGGTADGSPATHTYADNGTFVITGTATELVDTASTRSDTATIQVRNVAPTFTSTAPTAATEGVEYAYDATATDPGADTLTFSLVSGPTGMTVSDAGAVRWTPDGLDFRPRDVTVRVSDGDGGTTDQSWTIAVSFVDTDMGGAPDSCESRAGLDPDDGSDDLSDLDGDGLAAADECIAGTDPAVFSGPTAPELVSPIGRATWVDRNVVLTLENVADPDGDAVQYDFELYADEALETLAGETLDVAPEAGATTRGSIDGGTLVEDTVYFWRARATTADVDGPWSEAESFVYNRENASPDRPTILAPAGFADTVRPTLQVQNSVDPEGELLTYSFELFEGPSTGGTPLFTAIDVPGGEDGTTEAVVDTDLTEGGVYAWRVRATDNGRPRRSSAYAIDSFRVNTANDAPEEPVLVSPVGGELVPGGDGVVLRWLNSVDADGDAVSYDGALARDEAFSDLVLSFDGQPGGADGATRVVVPESLPDGTTYWWRVRATDGTLSSTYASTSFATTQPNRAPGTPTPVAPRGGTEVEEGPGGVELIIGHAEDPDVGQLISYDVQVATDSAVTAVIAFQQGIVEAEGEQTSARVPALPYGTLFWRVRAFDGELYGPWSESVGFRLVSEVIDVPDAGVDGGIDAGDDATADAGEDAGRPRGYDSTLGGGGGCAAAAPGAFALPWLLLCGALAPRVRRRRTP